MADENMGNGESDECAVSRMSAQVAVRTEILFLSDILQRCHTRWCEAIAVGEVNRARVICGPFLFLCLCLALACSFSKTFDGSFLGALAGAFLGSFLGAFGREFSFAFVFVRRLGEDGPRGRQRGDSHSLGWCGTS